VKNKSRPNKRKK